MPQKPNIIATKTISGEVHIFDYLKHPPVPEDTENINPELILTGPTEEGYGLSWNEKRPGYILSGGNDSVVEIIDYLQNSSIINCRYTCGILMVRAKKTER